MNSKKTYDTINSFPINNDIFNSYSFFRIEITVNVNHSVDADINEAEMNPKADNVPAPEMKSKPDRKSVV